jgi:hypothetical protein
MHRAISEPTAAARREKEEAMRYSMIALVTATAGVLALSSQASAQQWNPDRARPFSPQWAAPQLEVQPRGGPPGTPVRITGEGVGGADVRAYYGDRRMEILRRGDDTLVAEIPAGVRGDDFIYVVGDGGRARTVERYDLQSRFRDQDRRSRYYDQPWESERYQPWESEDYDRYDRRDLTDPDERFWEDRYERRYDRPYDRTPYDRSDRPSDRGFDPGDLLEEQQRDGDWLDDLSDLF